MEGSWYPGKLRPLSIRQVRTLGRRPTYEITMRAPWHNYLAEGVLTSNSHAVAYGQLAYRMAWLKAHHPAAFWAATLNQETGCPSQMERYLSAARRQGIRILPPDINISCARFAPVGDAIRCGLEVVRGIGGAAVEALVQLRQGGAFLSLPDLVSRLPGALATVPVLENLVRVGALDAFEGNRAQKLAAVTSWVDWRKSPRAAFPALPSCPEWTVGQRLWEERLAAGVWLTGHPLDGWEAFLSGLGCLPPAAAQEVKPGGKFRLGGIIGEVKVRPVRQGEQAGQDLAIVTLESPQGAAQVWFWPPTWGTVKNEIVCGHLVIVEGTVAALKTGAPRLTGQQVWNQEAALTLLPAMTLVADAAGLVAVEKALSELGTKAGNESRLVRLYLSQRMEDGRVVPRVNERVGVDTPPRLAPEEAATRLASVVPDIEIHRGFIPAEASGSSLITVWPRPAHSPDCDLAPLR